MPIGRRDLGPRPFQATRSSAVDFETHLLRRLSYGPAPGDLDQLRAVSADAYLEQQLHPERIDDTFCESLVRRFETLAAPVGELFEYRPELLMKELAGAAVLRAVYSRRQLYEVMVEFWTDHFNIAASKGDCAWLKTADDRNVIRRHALGRFPELVRASALSPAMLWYLDGRMNRRRNPEEKPNENYARELLELHTLGIHGGYTQHDVMEVARCLTGWTVRSREWLKKGHVEFRPKWHDDGEKAVLGRKILAGMREKDLDRVLEIVATHPATAEHVAAKLCRRFISDSPPDDAVQRVAGAFSRTDGDIRDTLRALFTSEAFRTVRDTKLKRPYRFIVSALRASCAEVNSTEGVGEYLVRMGHVPFQYPTPDGYPEEPEPWLGTLLWRWHFASMLATNKISGVRVDWSRLAASAGNDAELTAHFLGRAPTTDEIRGYHACESGPALMLAAPAFQRY
ncbi:MAG: DUF1800 domain-containing protein [Candidatus Hydrogenedentes bacterium]|nr:DUF1800 domain-containing protein [Candidatus Hydrogenedentota bacterium]